MYGPKGVGGLYVRRRPRVRMKPIIDVRLLPRFSLAHRRHQSIATFLTQLLHTPRFPCRADVTVGVQGGGQERGLRSGTLPTPLVVGFGTACEVASQEMVRASPPLLLTACSSFSPFARSRWHVPRDYGCVSI